MKDTCIQKECPVFKKLKLKSVNQCPNFVETVFINDSNEKKVLQDCSTKRNLLMIQDIYSRLSGIQAVQEQHRNQIEPLVKVSKVLNERREELLLK